VNTNAKAVEDAFAQRECAAAGGSQLCQQPALSRRAKRSALKRGKTARSRAAESCPNQKSALLMDDRYEMIVSPSSVMLIRRVNLNEIGCDEQQPPSGKTSSVVIVQTDCFSPPETRVILASCKLAVTAIWPLPMLICHTTLGRLSAGERNAAQICVSFRKRLGPTVLSILLVAIVASLECCGRMPGPAQVHCNCRSRPRLLRHFSIRRRRATATLCAASAYDLSSGQGTTVNSPRTSQRKLRRRPLYWMRVM